MSPYAYLPMLTHLVCIHTLTYQSLTSVGTPAAGEGDSAICALYPGLSLKLVNPNGAVRREVDVNVPSVRSSAASGVPSGVPLARGRRNNVPLCLHACIAPKTALVFGWTGARVTVACPTDRVLRQVR